MSALRYPSSMGTVSVSKSANVRVESLSKLYLDGKSRVEQGATVICGVSLNNKQFTSDYLGRLIREFRTHQNPLILMVTDGPARHNYAALGLRNSALVAQRRNIHRCLRRAIEGHIENGSYQGPPIAVLNWSVVRRHPEFRSQLRHLCKLAQSHSIFRQEIDAVSAPALLSLSAYHRLSNHLDKFPSENQLRKSAYYFLEECAFLLAAPALLGVPDAVYAYHRRWQIFERLLLGQFDGIERQRLSLYLPAAGRSTEVDSES